MQIAQRKRVQVNETSTPETSIELIVTANQVSPLLSAIPIFNLIDRIWQLDSDMCFSVRAVGKWPRMLTSRSGLIDVINNGQ